jgi:tetratricopeptide (TPR) repeat protein
MPSVHTRERVRRAKKPSKSTATDPIEREYRRLALAVGDVTGFRLYVATYSNPRLRDRLIERLQVEQVSQKICITTLDLTGCDRESSLARLLREHIEKTRPEPSWRQAVMVTGLEDLLDYGREADMRFLETANLQRDVLPTSAPVAVVLWLSPLASAAFPRAAPDLWHWRGAGFDFTGFAGGRVELLRDLVAIPDEREPGLSGDKQRERAAMLEELLAELDKSGPPKSPRETAERANLLGQLGQTYLDLGRAREALPLFERQLALAREIGDRRDEGNALGNLGFVHADLGERRRAIEYYEQALVILREIGDRPVESVALVALGRAYADYLGEPRRAIEYYEQALAIARELGDQSIKGKTLFNLGGAWATLGEAQRAIEYYEQALAIAREIGDRGGESRALVHLGAAYASRGELERAIEFLEQSLAVARTSGNRSLEGPTLGALGAIYAALGETRRAIEYFELALAIARKIGDRRGQGRALNSWALALEGLGERAEALKKADAALAIFEGIEDPNAARARALVERLRGAAAIPVGSDVGASEEGRGR